MNRREALKILASEPVFWSRMGFGYDPPRLKDGKPIIFNENYAEYRRVHDDFGKAGIRIHTCILFSGWVGVDKYDYSATDRCLDELLGGNDWLFIPRIKLNVPPDWCKVHPEEVFVYCNGPRKAEDIAALVNTDKHDWFGFESPDGYPVNGGTGFTDDRPNVGGVIGLQSFSSEVWLHDAGIALEKLMEHLENGKYGDRIMGYHVAWGCCGETTQWGAWRPSNENYRGDYGISHLADFRRWAIEKYGSEKEALASWKLSEDTDFAHLEPPCPNDRERTGHDLAGDYYSDCALMPDYNAFLSEKNADAVEALCRLVHEKSGKLAGAFYGYMMVPQCAYSGHLALERILNSPHVDFLCSPKSYDWHTVGEPGGEQCPSRSYNRKKLWLDEVDNRTHLERRGTNDMTHNMEETLTVLWRECMKNLTGNQNFWWMDLGEGWFDDPEIMANIKTMFEVQKKVNETPHRSVSEVLLVVDEDSLLRSKVSVGLTEALRKRFDREAKLTGAPVDMFRLRDLTAMDLSQYKVICFIDTAYLPDALWEKIRPRMRKNATIVWNYCCGVLNPEYDLSHGKKITGFAVREAEVHSSFLYDNIHRDFTPLRIEAETGVTAVLKDENGIVLGKKAEETGISYYAAEPVLTYNLLHDIFAESNVHFYADAPCAVYADNRLLSLFSHFSAVEGEITLPEKMTLRNLKTGEVWENVDVLPVSLPEKRMELYEILR